MAKALAPERHQRLVDSMIRPTSIQTFSNCFIRFFVALHTVFSLVYGLRFYGVLSGFIGFTEFSVVSSVLRTFHRIHWFIGYIRFHGYMGLLDYLWYLSELVLCPSRFFPTGFYCVGFNDPNGRLIYVRFFFFGLAVAARGGSVVSLLCPAT